MMIRQLSLCTLLGVLAATAQAQPDVSERGLDGFVQLDRLPVPESPVLALGREVWGTTCMNCHGGNKLTGAPKITSTRAWAPRIDRGMDMMIARAIEGFIGPTYAQMPARGGNEALSDADIGAAVAFMVWASGGDRIAAAYADTQQEMDK